jgi:hypothetical protein
VDAAIAVADAPVAIATPDAGCARRAMGNSRRDFPAPTVADGATGGWFTDGHKTYQITSTCDLRDRVAMVSDDLWVWQRADGSSKHYKIDEELGHMGHSTVVAKAAPAEDHVLDSIIEGPSIFIETRLGPSYAKLVTCRYAGEGVDALIACSTKQHYAEIDVLEPAECATYPGGIGWPLSLTLWDSKDAKVTSPGALAAVDGGTWTYRFGDVSLVLHTGDTQTAELHVGDRSEPCTMIHADHRRVP